VFLYTNKELSEKEITKTVPFTLARQRIKYLGNNQRGKDLYTENYKALMKEIKRH